MKKIIGIIAMIILLFVSVFAYVPTAKDKVILEFVEQKVDEMDDKEKLEILINKIDAIKFQFVSKARIFYVLEYIQEYAQEKLDEMNLELGCLSTTEKELYDLIMDYREDNGLESINLSSSLNKVAQSHVRDLYYNDDISDQCNMHSWYGQGNWNSCCYTADHANAECMWNKPKELTNYEGIGFEISFYDSQGVTPSSALAGWKQSPGHNNLLVNIGAWKEIEWGAIGIGIYKNYAVVWFGEEEDSAAVCTSD